MPAPRIERLIARLEKGRAALQRAFADLPPEQWQRTVYAEPAVWTVRDVLAHLLSAEEGLRMLAQEAASGGEGAPEGMDYHAFNAAEQERLRALSPEELLAAWGEARNATLAMVRGLEKRQLDREGRHPALGIVTVETILNAIYGHQLMHLRDLPVEGSPRHRSAC